VQLRSPSELNIVVDGVAERKTGMRQMGYHKSRTIQN
jgi:hypothetical protein